MNKFLSEVKTGAHWFAGFMVSAAAAYIYNPTVHQTVNNVIAQFPKLSAFIVAITPAVTFYLNSRKQPAA